MRLLWVVALLAGIMLCGAASAQLIGIDATSLGRGGTSLATQNDAAASVTDPVGFPGGRAKGDEPQWAHDLSVACGSDFEGNWDISGALRFRDRRYGRAYTVSFAKDTVVGVSVGANLGKGINGGFSLVAGQDMKSVMSLSASLTTQQGDGPTTFAAKVRDLRDAKFDVGVAHQVSDTLEVAVDGRDLADKVDTSVGAGVTWSPAERPYSLSAGVMDIGGDSDLTAGITWVTGPWKLDAGIAFTDPDNTWEFGVRRTF